MPVAGQTTVAVEPRVLPCALRLNVRFANERSYGGGCQRVTDAFGSSIWGFPVLLVFRAGEVRHARVGATRAQVHYIFGSFF